MAFDGAALYVVAKELNSQLSGGRIDKIHQISKEQLRITVRTKAGASRLLLSASSNDARIHLTEQSADNPQQPPMFCMMLRKRLSGGFIKEIMHAMNWETIPNIYFAMKLWADTAI